MEITNRKPITAASLSLAKATLSTSDAALTSSTSTTSPVSGTNNSSQNANVGNDNHTARGGASSGKSSSDDSNLKNDNRSRDMMTRTSILGSLSSRFQWLCSMKFLVLIVLCMQNSLFTVLRRYSQGVLHEQYSKYEALLLAELIKMVVSARMIHGELRLAVLANNSSSSSGSSSLDNSPSHNSRITKAGVGDEPSSKSSSTTSCSSASSSLSLWDRLRYLIGSSRKMVVLACIYGTMNILSFYSLRNIGAGMFTIFAQCKIMTTAIFSTIILKRQYSWTKWRALISLMLGVVLFSEPIWGNSSSGGGSQNEIENVGGSGDGDGSSLVQLAATTTTQGSNPTARPLLGMCTQAIEVTLSGFASIYFEKVIKVDAAKHTIWERNFQLALASIPVHVMFILYNGGGVAGFGGGWSFTAVCVSLLGAAGGLLVALSIKYGDAILKTLATTGSIIISSVLDHFLLGGPLSGFMAIAGGQVVLSICNYTFDATPPPPVSPSSSDSTNGTAASDSNAHQQQAKETTGKNEEQELTALLRKESFNDASQGGTARVAPVSVV